MKKLTLLLSLLALGALGLVACDGGGEETTALSASEARAGSGGEATAVESSSGTTSQPASMEENVGRKAGDWAAAFGPGRPAWRFTGQPVGSRIACERVPNRPIENCTPPSPAFRESFADATVERVVIDDREAESAPIVATVEFSNGASVEFQGPHGWYVSRRWAKEITRRNFEP